MFFYVSNQINCFFNCIPVIVWVFSYEGQNLIHLECLFIDYTLGTYKHISVQGYRGYIMLYMNVYSMKVNGLVYNFVQLVNYFF